MDTLSRWLLAISLAILSVGSIVADIHTIDHGHPYFGAVGLALTTVAIVFALLVIIFE
jgi:hypothetical protein